MNKFIKFCRAFISDANAVYSEKQPEPVKIIQICVTDLKVLGLGDNGIVYWSCGNEWNVFIDGGV